MSKRKYTEGKQICTISDFENSDCSYFVVYFGYGNPQTKHRSFLTSWQYRTLKSFIMCGAVFEAEDLEGDNYG